MGSQFNSENASHRSSRSSAWWSSYLEGAHLSFFPSVASLPSSIKHDGILVQKLPWSWVPSGDFDEAAFLKTAWALVAGTYSGSNDVIFGTYLRSQRENSAQTKDTTTALNIVPTRVQWTSDQAIYALASAMKRQETEMMVLEDPNPAPSIQATPDGRNASRYTCLLDVYHEADRAATGAVASKGHSSPGNSAQSVSASVPLSVRCELSGNELRITASFDRSLVSENFLVRIITLLEQSITAMSRDLSEPISSLKLMTEVDVLQVLQWNSQKPTVVRDTAHELFRRQARRRPSHIALSSWDGELTYAQLDGVSDRFASHLRNMGVREEVMVPICFEKSIWAVVAMLSVLKAGGAFAVIEPSHPPERKAVIARQLKAGLAIVAPSTKALFPRDCVDAVVTCDPSVQELPLPSAPLRAGVPENAMYVIFTSGSTGTPKGCVTEHWSFCSSMYDFGRDSKMRQDCQVLQFASYSFDTSLEETFCTLFAGATLHIPSESARINDLAGEIRRTKTNWAELNPKVLSLLAPEEVPTLQTIILGGDRSHGSDVCRWPSHVALFNSYGCTEASVTSTLIDMRERRNEEPPIGFGVGCNLWIVNPEDHNKLVPVGAPGELLIEGPGLARGYLDDEERTTRSFVRSPAWADESSSKGRRFYKTGDIARYNGEGAVLYQGRKDSQVKIRGQRVELGEIEHQLSQAVPDHRVSVEVAALQPGSKSPDTLAAFIVLSKPDSQTEQTSVLLDADTVQTLADLRGNVTEILSRSLPSYMLPTLYVPISRMPLTISAKADRRKLRALVEALTGEQVALLQGQGDAKQQPTSDAERQIQAIWATVLKVSPESIGVDDDFLRIGGDSILAMKLVAASRQVGYQMSVRDILLHPVLRDLAAYAVSVANQDSQPVAVEPFSLVRPEVKESFVREAAEQCAVRPDDVQDLYPCTPLQEGLISLSAKQPGSYIMRKVMVLPEDIRMADFHRAWEIVAEAHPILRTRIVAVGGSTMLQAVVAKLPSWETAIDLDRYIKHDDARRVGLGDALGRYAIIPSYNRFFFVWTAHHCIYDGWSLPIILGAVAKVYNGASIGDIAPPGYNKFIKSLMDMDQTSAESFWQSYLEGSSTTFPAALPTNETAHPTAVLQKTAKVSPKGVDGITATTVLRAAWALVMRGYTGDSDVSFGTTVSGRNNPVHGIEDMSGPTIATVPFRVRWDKQDPPTVMQWLQAIQEDTVKMIPFEQAGLQNIAKVSKDAQAACQFGALFVVQLDDDEDKDVNQVMAPFETTQDSFDESTTEPLLVECTLDEVNQQVRIHARYDPKLVESPLATRMLDQFSHILSTLYSVPLHELSVEQLELVSPADRRKLSQWNEGRINPIDTTMHDLVAAAAVDHADRPALRAWDGDMSFAELEAVSSQVAGLLRSLGVSGKGEMVLLCFEKSKWAIVSALAIMKAGAAFVALDLSQPDERLSTIMALSKARIVLASQALEPRLTRLSKNAPSVLCTASLASGQSRRLSGSTALLAVAGPTAGPDDLAYAIFTSGSTGTPKGVLISHRAAASSMTAHGASFGIAESSRTLQFASLTFDASIFEIFTTLAFGGCVCIPSDAQRLDDLGAAINDMDINTVMLTPSVLALLEPASVPGICSIISIAEQVTDRDIERWSGRLHVVCVTNPHLRNGGHIGHATGCRAWVVRDNDVDQLVPIGGIGELLIESPSLAMGYLNDPERTQASFIEDPAWTQKVGYSDTIVEAGSHRRFYKTGDLVRQMSDGSFYYFGRKDSQVKLRGQRIELGEVDFHISRAVPTAVVRSEIVHLQGQQTDSPLVPALAAFVVCEGLGIDLTTGVGLNENLLSRLQEVSSTVLPEMSRSVPPYMIPAIFIPIDGVPLTSSGKTDRMKLKSLAAKIPHKHLEILRRSLKKNPGQVTKTAPQDDRQASMQSVWAAVLQLDKSAIGVNDNFFQLGGDSISAMRLVTAARSAGMNLSVAQVFKTPVLEDLCQPGQAVEVQSQASITPFSLVPAFDKLLHQEAASQCGVPQEEIRDLYPATALQQGFISLSAKEEGTYIIRDIFRLRNVDLYRFRRAWEYVAHANAILRTRLVHLEAYGTMQAVLGTTSAFEWHTASSLDACLAEDDEHKMGLGTPLTRYGLIQPTQRGGDAFFDSRDTPFNILIKYIQDMEPAAATDFWKSYLDGSSASLFPNVPHVATHKYRADGKGSVTIPWSWRSRDGVTTSALLRTAYAVLIGAYTGSNDVVYGTTLSGRNAPIPRIENMMGPTIVTVPLRLKWDSDTTVSELLTTSQRQATDMIPFEQLGLRDISKLSSAAEAACQFRSLFVVQQEWGQESPDCEKLFVEHTPDALDQKDAPATYQTYPLGLEVFIGEDQLRMAATYDSHLIDSEEIRRILTQLGHVASLLQKHPNTPVSELNPAGPEDLALIQEWNSQGPFLGVPASVNEVIGSNEMTRPSAAAVSAWDGDLTYKELAALSNGLAHRLRAMGVGVGSDDHTVALSHGKSRWVPVMMLAVLKAGGTFVALDPDHPVSRLNFILDQASIKILLTSEELAQSSSLTELDIKKVFPASLEFTQEEQAASPPPPSSRSVPIAETAAYVVFTSGSTGTPKGVMVSHSATISSTLAHGGAMGINKDSRVLQFSSYTFDACVLEIFGSLLAGACVCIPSKDECSGDINAAVLKYSINFAALTPRVASLLEPEKVPNIKAIALGAEVVTTTDIQRWQGRRVSNGYGPTECTVVCVMESSNHKPGRIGKAVGCTSWIVDPEDANKLAPVGAPGELLIEGPCLAMRYMGDEEKTRSSFVENLKWMGSFPNLTGRPRRCYKTGDVVRYDTDGGLLFMGRKDTQAKLRGLRIELSEVQHHLGQLLEEHQVIADIVSLPQESKDSVALVAFVVPPSSEVLVTSGEGPLLALESDLVQQLSQSWSSVAAEMARRVPSYMVPSMYIPLSKIPLNTSSKRDRQKLQALAESIPQDMLELLRGVQGVKEPPRTPLEIKMASVWARMLNIDVSRIGIHDSFFHLGGDSISAMRLVSLAAEMSISMRVSDIFKFPVLSDLCLCLQKAQKQLSGDEWSEVSAVGSEEPSTDSDAGKEGEAGLIQKLLGAGSYHADSRSDLSSSDGSIMSPDDCRIAPALSHQVLSYEFSHLRHRGLVNYFSLSFLETFSYERIRAACKQLVRHHSILRTQLRLADGQLWQIVMPPERATFRIELFHTELADVGDFAARLIEMDVSRRLSSAELENPTKFFVIQSTCMTSARLVMRLGHSHYDGLAFPLLLNTFTHALRNRSSESLPEEMPFHRYASSIERLPKAKSLAYWKQLLEGSRLTPIITPAAATANDGRVGSLTRLVPLPELSKSGYTFATVLKAAWAVVLAQHSGLDDVVFGCLVSGRMAPVPNCEMVVGPTLDIAPVRAKLGGDNSSTNTAGFLRAMNDQYTSSMDHDHLGWRAIVAEATDWPQTQQRTLFAEASVVQHQNIPLADELNEILPDLPFELRARGSTGNAAAIWIITTAHPGENLLSIDFEYAHDSVGLSMAEKLLDALCVAIDHFGANWKKSGVALPDVRMSPPSPSADLQSAATVDDGCNVVLSDKPPLPLGEEAKTAQDLVETPGSPGPVGPANSAGVNHEGAEKLVLQAWNMLMSRGIAGKGIAAPSLTSSTSMFDSWDINLVAVALRSIYEELGICVFLDQLLQHPTIREQAALVSLLGHS
ncbi:uncharacterized protein PG998_005479 [Apiospora kogelbergensis]|uniref:uncharacterized protein n=1 Tax=Apiospora kogelbergensis TaxID=1337665 RepID=UPI00312DED5F